MARRVVIISDTHNLHRSIKVPDGDILIHAGDLTRRGDLADVHDFNAFLGTLPHRHKVVIAGNHDFCFESDPAAAAGALTNCIYLQDAAVTIEGLQIYGSPWQPWFHDWAFNLPRGRRLQEKWQQIPPGTDILITHGPPFGIGDRVWSGEQVGCEDLLAAVERLRPRLHIFGHIHEGYGTLVQGDIQFINASCCNRYTMPVNPPIVVDI
jgi:Icc-related predicted phosphoesterase